MFGARMARRAGQRRPGDPAARGLTTRRALGARRLRRRRGYTQATFFRTRTLSRWARAHLFFGAEAGAEGSADDGARVERACRAAGDDRGTASGARSRGRADRARAARRRRRCGSTSTTPTGSTWRSASGSPTSSATCSSASRSRSPRPGADRPLTKPEHFRRFLGRRVRVRTREAIEGRRNFTGTLDRRPTTTASRSTPTAATVGSRSPGIRRSNLVPELRLEVSA